MSTVSELIKAAHSNGEPLFKGAWSEEDHPRDGDGRFAESANANAAANEASSRAKRTDNANEHARAARLHWRASRLAMNQEDADRHAVEARTHDLRANR